MLIAVVLLAPAYIRRSRRRAAELKPALRIAALGGLFFAADLSSWATGVMLSEATNPTLLANTAPLWVGLGAMVLFKEQLKGRFWVGTILALCGAALVLRLDLADSADASLGSMLGLLAGLFYGGYFLVTQRGRAALDSISYFWPAAASSTIVLFAASLALRFPLWGYPLQSYLSFVGIGIVSQVIGYLAITYALGHLPASLVAPSLLGQPVVTALLASQLLGETIGALQALGGIAVLIGVALVHHGRGPRIRSTNGASPSPPPDPQPA